MRLYYRSLVFSALLFAVLSPRSSVASTPPMHFVLWSKAHTIHVSVRNDRSEPIELRMGTTIKRIESGKTVEISGVEGTQIFANTPIGEIKEGEVAIVLDSALNGNTVVFKR